MLENTNTEFKGAYSTKVNKVLLSFLNTDGGRLYLGISDDGRVEGITDPDAEMLRVTHSFRDSVTPDPTAFMTAAPTVRDGKNVIEFAVERGLALPYCFKEYGLVPKGVYVRVGSESVPASREHIKQMIRDNDGEKFVDALSLNQNLTFDYAERVFEDKGIAFGEPQKKSLGLVRADERYSNLALLISDQCPYSIKTAIFAGTTKEIFKDRKEFTGSIFRQIDEVLAYLHVYNKVSSTFEGAYRIDRADYPEIVFREALINAVIHRDYYIEGDILVSLFSDRTEIMSLGGVLPGVTPELMLSGVSVPRNDKLAAMFFRLTLIEAYGTGIPRIYETYAKFGATPSIPIINGGFLISLPNLSVAAAVPNAVSCNNEQRILTHFVAGEFTKQDAADFLGISASGAYKLLQRMVEHESLQSSRRGREIVYQQAATENE
jgi:ATP-dependent DNA helicase RecG